MLATFFVIFVIFQCIESVHQNLKSVDSTFRLQHPSPTSNVTVQVMVGSRIIMLVTFFDGEYLSSIFHINSPHHKYHFGDSVVGCHHSEIFTKIPRFLPQKFWSHQFEVTNINVTKFLIHRSNDIRMMKSKF